jgi:probable H4MPT-linked C1 transfer pathway protein
MADCIGWDLGGAHLKAVRLDEAGRALVVVQLPCPLWRGLNHLDSAIDQALTTLGEAENHVVTMTGELSDIFPNRHEGVERLVETMRQKLPTAKLRIFSGIGSFIVPEQAEKYAGKIASANWQASAQYAARCCGDGIFVDIGSTTTDIVLLQGGNAKPQGFTDAARLMTEELVYTGIIRTPVMAVAHRAPFDGQWQRLAAEHFATMADVHRLTGNLDAMHDMAEPADGAGKTLRESARRLARMVGRDVDDALMEQWIGLAHFFSDAQLLEIQMAVVRILSQGIVNESAPLIGAGTGRFMVRELARRMRREYVDFAELVQGTDAVRAWAAVCAPAFAVAWLEKNQCSPCC